MSKTDTDYSNLTCPLCGGAMTHHYRSIADGPIKGYDDTYSCGNCEMVMTVKIQQHSELYAVVAGRES